MARISRGSVRLGEYKTCTGETDVAVGQLDLAESFYGRDVKRAVDLILAPLALIASLPVIFVAAILIVLDSKGSPLYKQARVGRNGVMFEIYKLRTMHLGTESLGFSTSDYDPRVTRIGKILRQRKFDELPQLWNVIVGDMSLIGPRPLSADECSHLVEQHIVTPATPGFYPKLRPGLTGLEQINRSAVTPYSERFAWNYQYECKLSFLLDLRIFFTTVAKCKLVSGATTMAGLLQLAIWFGFFN